MRTRGFTMVELVVVMVIIGIIAAVMGVFLKPAMESYFDTQRRAALTDAADTALRRIGRDVRSAVPNSIRTPGNQCFELVPTSTGGRYRMAPDTVNSVGLSLDITQAVTTFDVLSQMSVTPAPGDWVVIDNQNTNDVYAGTNRHVISTIAAIPAPTPPTLAAGLSRITLASGTNQFPSGYQGGAFVVVPDNGGKPAVSYVCSGAGVDAQGNGTGTLYRVTEAFNPTYPTTASCQAFNALNAAIVASNVQSCDFEYNANEGASQQSGFVWMQLSLTQANESISISYGVHVDNTP